MALGREADAMDLLSDAVGIVIGLVIAATPLGGWARWLESLSQGQRR